jgi:hypothetical protein
MRFVLFAVLALASFGASADTAVVPPMDVPAITAQQKVIQSEIIAERGRYKDLPANTRMELLSRQAAMMSLLQGKSSAAELTADERTKVFNTLEWMEAAINQESDDERLVCRREKPLGSTRTTRICRTVAQEREAKERARQELENVNGIQNRR